MKETRAELQARQGKLEARIRELREKKDAESQANLRADMAEMKEIDALLEAATAKEELDKAKALEAKRKEDAADAAVEAMIVAGEIGPRELDVKAKWRQDFINNPDLIGRVKGTEPRLAPVEKARQVTAGAIQGQDIKDNTSVDGNRITISADVKGALRSMAQITAAAGKNSDRKAKFSASYDIGFMYRTEIQPLMAKNVNLPLQAATTADDLGTLAGTLVALRTLDLFKYELPMLDSITTDFSELPAQFNQTTDTRVVVVPAVLSYNNTNDSTGRPLGYEPATLAQTIDAPVTLNQHKAVVIIFDANTLASTQRRLFDEQAPAAAYAMGLDITNNLYAKITAANFTTASTNYPVPNATISVPSIDYGRPTFAQAKQILNIAGAPMPNRTALSNSVYQAQLEQDPSITQLAAFQMREIITESTLPSIAKFRPIEAPNLPANAFGAKTLQAFFLHKSALIMQTRIPNDWSTVLGPGNSYGSVNVVTNPDTGISMLLVQYSNPNQAYAEYRLALMYGTNVGNPLGGVVVTN